MNKPATRSVRRLGSLALTLALLPAARFAIAGVPPTEKLLPDDTMAVLTTPDFSKLHEYYGRSPQNRFLEDPAMKPFRDKFVSKWNEEFVKPLEQELGVRLDDYYGLLQGQVTVALTRNGWLSKEGQSPGLLLLVDTKDKSTQLKSTLAALRKKWSDSGRKMRTVKFRDFEFTEVTLSTNDLPKTLREFVPDKPEADQDGGTDRPQKSGSTDLVLGQADSLLVIANTAKVAEQVVLRLTGGSQPSLSDDSLYQANHQALFRNSPLYGWLNAKAFVDAAARDLAKQKSAEGGDPFASFEPGRVISGLGLNGLKTIAFNYEPSSEGALVQLFVGVPEAERTGLFKLLTGEPKETTPPPFVPADALKFQRVRLDGPKAWTTIEKMAGDMFPQAVNGINFLLDTVNTAAREKNPDFDVRKSLIGNLGNDFITWERLPGGAAGTSDAETHMIMLIGSPKPAELASAIKSVMMFIGASAGAPTEREYLGRKICTLPLPAFPLPSSGSKSPMPKAVTYAATADYIAVSTEAGMVEDYLRSLENPRKSLRNVSGLTDAAARVGVPGTSLLGYGNQAATMRNAFEMLRKSSSTDSSTLAPIPGAEKVAKAEKSLRSWLDFSLLPPYEKVAKYFHYSVYGGSASASGLTLKVFAPVPPGLLGGDTPAAAPTPKAPVAPPPPPNSSGVRPPEPK